MIPPTLKTARLTLAFPHMHEGMDVSHYVRWLNDEAVTQYSEQRHYVHCEASQFAYLGTMKSASHLAFWQIDRNERPIGSLSAQLDVHNKVANLGVMIGERKQWNNGYASEAWDAVCEYLFENNYRKIEAGCMASNGAMQSILDRTGFRYEAKVPNHFLRDGKPEDKLLYGKFRKAKVYSLQKAVEGSSAAANGI